MEKVNNEKTQKNTCCKPLCSCIGSVLSGLGSLAIGVAAILGACKAPEISRTLYAMKLTQTNNTNVHIYPTSEKAEKTIKEGVGKSKENLDSWVEDLPSSPETGDEDDLFIAPAYRDAVKLELKSEPSNIKREAILRGYFQRSIEAKTKDK